VVESAVVEASSNARGFSEAAGSSNGATFDHVRSSGE